jgi:predicted metal-dependent peptidase
MSDRSEVSEAERRRLAAQRMAMLEAHPFWGYLLMQMRLIPAPDLPTFMVSDGLNTIWFNPHLSKLLEPAELGFVLAHQIAHQFLLTEPRRLGRDPLRWNQATDYVINRLVAEIRDPAGTGESLYHPPEGSFPGVGEVRPLVEPAFKRLVAEAIYARLPETREAAPLPLLDLELPMGEAGDGSMLRVSGVVDHGGGLDLHLPVPLAEGDREELRDRLAQALVYHESVDSRGHVPMDFLRALRLTGRARVPWQQVLYRYMDQALSRDDYSRTRPNRKYMQYDLVVPGLSGEQVESVVVAVDTSGSMSDALVIRLVREIRELARNAAEITIVVADAEVHRVVEHDGIDDWLRSPDLPGGGGTDHRPVFDYLEARRLHPAIFIGLTDLHSEFPPRQPHFPVLWLVPPDHGTAPWGGSLVVEETL